MTDYKKWDQINASIEDDEEDKARTRLKDLKNDMSQKELRRIHDCWHEPEFRGMFDEYVQEVSDPKHKAETEQYLTQCEAEQRAASAGPEISQLGADGVGGIGGPPAGMAPPSGPKGSVLLKPKKGFVLKTFKREAGKKDFDRDMGKVFINVCAHEDIEKPSSTVIDRNGQKGESWSLPNLCSPKPKEDKAKDGHACMVIDIVFHPQALERGEAGHLTLAERWKQMVAQTAIDMVGKHHNLDLDPEYKMLKMRYYGGEGQGPSTLAWQPTKAFEGKGGEKPPAAETTKAERKPARSERSADALYAGHLGGKSTVNAGDATSAPAAATKPPPPAAATTPAAPPPAPAAAVAPAALGVKTPKHSLVHRGSGSMGGGMAAAWSDTRMHEDAARPKELLLRVELPETTSAAEVDLDITARKVELTEEKHGYLLELPLPYDVEPAEGSAKFDKSKRVLSVTLPLTAAARSAPRWEPSSAGQSPAEVEAELAAAAAAEKTAKEAAEAEAAAKREAERESRRLVAEAEAAKRETERKAAVARAAAENEARLRAQKSGAPPSRPGPAVSAKPAAPTPVKAVPPPAAAAPQTTTPEGDFQAASGYAGCPAGFVFKTGDRGLGYYRDARAHGRAAEPGQQQAERAGGSEGDGASTKGSPTREEWVMVGREEATADKGAAADKVATPDKGQQPGATDEKPSAAAPGLTGLKNNFLFELD